MTRIFIEDNELDIDKELVNRITYAIDDLEKLDTKTTSFSKTIVLPGTTNNNYLLGNIFEFNNSNYTYNNAPNVKYNFNAAKAAQCRIEVNGLQIIKGVFQLLEIVYDNGQIEYECSVRGELGGFISVVGNLRLEDLDFSDYDQDWTNANIVASWDSGNTGAGVYYPLVDIGLVSTGAFGVAKKDYQYRAFRPALHVREYLDKIITNAGYTWESPFCDTDFFKRLIIPHNSKALTIVSSTVLDVRYSGAGQYLYFPQTVREIQHPTQITLGSFTADMNNAVFTYGGTPTITGLFRIRTTVIVNNNQVEYNLSYEVHKNGVAIETYIFPYVDNVPTTFNISYDLNLTFATGDTIALYLMGGITEPTQLYEAYVTASTMFMSTATANPVQLNLGEAIVMNDTIPRGIYQKDFFASLLKMFYLLVTEDKFKDRHLIITPWVDFYDLDPTTYLDWSAKLDRMKQIRVKPMSEVNARFYELKYKNDSDFYIAAYRKKFNEGYGDMFYDNGLEFSKEKETVEVVFANAVLVGYAGEDKVVPTIFKKSNEIEERIDHVVRIMQAKKITGVTSWDIMNSGTVLSSHTVYPYAGHLDDPDAPDADICFGVPKELQFALVSGNLSNNLFNAYYSSFMAEITDKDSRLLSGLIKLTETDIYNLDFSKFIYIDGGIYRLQKLIDYAAGDNETTKAELLRVIYTTY